MKDLTIAELLSYRDKVLADIVNLRKLKLDNVNSGIDSAIELQQSIVKNIMIELKKRGMYADKT